MRYRHAATVFAILFTFTGCFARGGYRGAGGVTVTLPNADPARIATHISLLAEEDDARMAGWPGEADAAAYVARVWTEAGFDVETTRFPVWAFRSSSATVTLSDSHRMDARSFIYGGATSDIGVTGILVDGGLGRKEDLRGRSAEVRGKILLMRRGEIRFSEKAARAAEAGALAAVIANNAPGTMVGTLAGPPGIPVVGIDEVSGNRLAEIAARGEKERVTVRVEAETRRGGSQNVVARRPGGEPFVVVGAHTDSVDTPGANDNASGVAALLEISRIIGSDASAPGDRAADRAEIRFVVFGAEEIGLIGSTDYVSRLTAAEQSRCRGVIVLDSVGTGSKLLVGTVDNRAKDRDLARFIVELDRGTLGAEVGDIAYSDHAPFHQAGIPAVLLISTPYDGIHTDADIPENLDIARISAVADLAAAAVLALAES